MTFQIKKSESITEETEAKSLSYDVHMEYTRMGIETRTNQWRFSTLNENYEVRIFNDRYLFSGKKSDSSQLYSFAVLPDLSKNLGGPSKN